MKKQALRTFTMLSFLLMLAAVTVSAQSFDRSQIGSTRPSKAFYSVLVILTSPKQGADVTIDG